MLQTGQAVILGREIQLLQGSFALQRQCKGTQTQLGVGANSLQGLACCRTHWRAGSRVAKSLEFSLADAKPIRILYLLLMQYQDNSDL